MFRPSSTQATYVKRLIMAVTLIIGMIVCFGMSVYSLEVGDSPDDGKGYFIACVVLLVLMGFLTLRMVLDILTAVTGMDWFLSGGVVFVLFALACSLSVLMIPIYIVFNAIQLIRARSIDRKISAGQW